MAKIRCKNMFSLKSFNVTLLVLILLIFSACSTGPDVPRDDDNILPEPEFRVVGYFPDYKISSVDDSVAISLTDIVFFSIEPKADGGLDLGRFGSAAQGKLKAMRVANPGLRVHIAVGGWGRSDGFAAMSLDSLTRRRFVTSLRTLCQTHNLAGVDYDWEFPANSAENKAYADLLVDTRDAFKGYNLQVSVALNVHQHLEQAAYEAVDRIHLMSYDHSGRHSTYDQAVSDVNNFLNRGVPANVICLGVPFYGRQIDNFSQSASYAAIVDEYYPIAAVDEIEGMYFNGRDTIARKAAFAFDSGLRGIMIWEIGQDASGDFSLLHAIAREVNNRAL